ncbi:MAG: 2-amino-4-hydroxy-6-hydroxymethyldihydropteridine diphosphokinase [Dehalococcoidia bacterium]|nr:2-amino-4-hydroxy-6-hydroxymethyldihydropteridine diphosphokinase [Dehalococcoidia bacterium]|tara:strand:+ start:4035 stop:4511 length:477 start_codon:yes stop_codon:yes gene_type:complete
MKSNTAYLSIGSNLGNRSENIKKCLSHISAISIIKATSSIIETEPFKVSIKQDNFLNLVVKIEFLKDHFELLNDINLIESKLGRIRSSVRNEPRIIDIDIIFFNDLIFSNDNLEIPHPRFKERLFVLQPLSEISPNFIDPITKKTIKFLLDEAKNTSN